MNLNDLIHERIVSSVVTAYLTTFGEGPAVFYQESPKDTDPGWSSSSYPRLEFVVDLSGDPERHSSGLLTCTVFCAEVDLPSENLEPALRTAVSDVFLQPEDGPPYAFGWARSEPFFNLVTEQGKKVNGIVVSFDLFAFPGQITSDPDPVQALQRWTKENTGYTVIGMDKLKDCTEAGDQTPVFYCRLTRVQMAYCTWSVSWFDSQLSLHVFAASPETRLIWTKCLVDALSRNPEIIMADGSPMMIKKIQGDSSADPIKQGQITLTVRYGALRQKTQYTPEMTAPEYTITGEMGTL